MAYLVFSVLRTGRAGGGMSMGREEGVAIGGRADTGNGAAVFKSLLQKKIIFNYATQLSA